MEKFAKKLASEQKCVQEFLKVQSNLKAGPIVKPLYGISTSPQPLYGISTSPQPLYGISEATMLYGIQPV